MVRLIVMLGLIFLALAHTGASCQGTETGNPGSPQAGSDSRETYSNGDYGVSTEYEGDWSFAENEPSGSGGVAPGSAGDVDGAVSSEIDTSDAPSTLFTDGTSTVTLFFVTLEEEPTSLLGYLQQLFSSRAFESFVNSEGTSGYLYDNPEVGATGGDRREYYFLNGPTLLLVVTDLSETNDGVEKGETLIDSLRFE